MIDQLLSRLDGVRETGRGRWIARCCAHADRNPSLALRELDDGRILLHCFAGCAIDEILNAIGLPIDALFPPRALSDRLPREKRPFNAIDVLACLSFEAAVAAMAADGLANGVPLSQADRDRLRLAASRLARGQEIANGNL